MADLKTNYVDDVLDSSKNQLRKYNMITNDDGTVSFVDVTTYTTQGTSFGAKDINDTNGAINQLNTDLSVLNESLSELNSNLVELYSRNMIRVPIVEPTVTTTNSKGVITVDVGLKVSSNFDYAHLDTLNFISFVTEWQTYNNASILNARYNPSTHTTTIFIYDGQAGQFKFGGYLLFGKYAIWN